MSKLQDILIQKGLSNREAEVASLVTMGLSNKEIGNQLFITEKTVKFHLTSLYKKNRCQIPSTNDRILLATR